MHYRIFRPLLGILALVFAVSCRQAKYVADGSYLHKKNTIYFETVSADGDTTEVKSPEGIYVGGMYDLVKPEPYKPVKLFFYNRIDSAKHTKQVDKKTAKINAKNEKRKAKEQKINDKRIEKARKKGKDYYNQKVKKMKPAKSGWRDWVIVHLGQRPVLLDTAAVPKSSRQLQIYMRQHGYYDATVRDTILYKEKKKKSFSEYVITTGEPYRIDTFKLGPLADANMQNMYKRFVKAEKSVITRGMIIDEDILNLERENFSKYCRDEGAFFGFNKSYITFEVDTLNGKGHSAKVIMNVSPKSIPHPTIKDSVVYVPHQTHYVRSVTFYLHNPDTMSFRNKYYLFERRCDALQLNYEESPGIYTLLDTLINIDTLITRKDTIITNKGVYIYNFEPFLEPDLIDKQNFLYIPHFAKEYYLERTYRTMLQLDVFSSITPQMEVSKTNPFGNQVDVVYHLIPAKRQTFILEPRMTNSNSVLGLSGTVSYTNKNLFGGAQKLKISFVGGFESQPLIVSAEGIDKQARKLNTFEWGPTIQLTFPKLVPMTRKFYEISSKRAYPQTKFDLAVNFQRRVEFSRRLAHFSYEWNFKVSKESGKKDEFAFQFVNFDFLRLEKEQFFIDKLNQLNDPFILNSYADHFSIYNGLMYKTDNQIANSNNPIVSILQVNILQAGGILNGTGWGSVDTNGLKTIFGVPFSQFIRIDNQYLFQWKISRKHKIATRALAGMGWAYGNSPSLPYEQSFYAGGSSDIRAFQARYMAPGGMRRYEDTTFTETQIGDMRLEVNLEYRFKINSLLEGALFSDMGNIWKVKDDPSTTFDDLGVFAFNSFWRQVAVGAGVGLRIDLAFLIVRADLAIPIHNPYLPAGERWIGTPHPQYFDYWDKDDNGVLEGTELTNYINPFSLKLNIGIGYPF